MRNNRFGRWGRMIAGLWIGVGAAGLIGIAGCGQGQPVKGPPVQVSGPGQGQRTFDTAEDAAQALLAAVKMEDREQARAAVRQIFGPTQRELLSGDPVEDSNGFKNFAKHAAEKLEVKKVTEEKSILLVGKEDWPFAIPIVKAANGKWWFDTAAGRDEILARRIGANELATIAVCRTYVQAQRQYASKDRDGGGVLKYARRFRSTPGREDGLYWEAAVGEELSPYGPLVADADLQGYSLGEKGSRRAPFHGYYFRILTKQGPAAPGGRYDYVINGNMIVGFALVAFPDKHGSSGVMTFIVNNQGKVYQKDLGPKTLDLARQMTEYDPDNSWTLVKD